MIHARGPLRVDTHRRRARWRCTCGAAGFVWWIRHCRPGAGELYGLALDELDAHRLRCAQSVEELVG